MQDLLRHSQDKSMETGIRIDFVLNEDDTIPISLIISAALCVICISFCIATFAGKFHGRKRRLISDFGVDEAAAPPPYEHNFTDDDEKAVDRRNMAEDLVELDTSA